MKKNIHWWIYSIGSALSILFIVLSFIDEMNQEWKNTLCSIGASGIGAVFLSLVLEWQNEVRRIKHNKTIFQALCAYIYKSLYYLLIVVNRMVSDIYKIMGVDNLS